MQEVLTQLGVENFRSEYYRPELQKLHGVGRMSSDEAVEVDQEHHDEDIFGPKYGPFFGARKVRSQCAGGLKVSDFVEHILPLHYDLGVVVRFGWH